MHKVTETQLFGLLKKREKVDGFDANDISSAVNKIISDSAPILEQVSRNFPLYTLHDPEHGFRVAENMVRIIPKHTLSILNSVEFSVLIYSAYLHDIGMASSQAEFYSWIDSENYKTFINANELWSNELYRIERMQRYKELDENDEHKTEQKQIKSLPIVYRQIQDIAYTEFLRINHAERGAKFIIDQFGINGRSDFKIQIGQVNYAEYVALVCKSHWENANTLRNEEFRRDLYIGQIPINLQYCSLLLRLADLIDLDPDRTPKILKDFIFNDVYKIEDINTSIKKTMKLSADEWAKHRAVLGYKISPSEIRIEAKCSHPAIQKGLIEWCNYIDAERINCRLVLQDNVKEITEKYHLELVNDVRNDYIKSDGSYIYADLKFSLDYERIVNLLMGTELWGDQDVVFRELLQNSIDACNHRSAICKKLNITYSPEIVFSNTYDEENNTTIISCHDNGMGMTKHLIEAYLMQIGKSYYNSTEFKNKHLGLYPISQFGLGLMSCFMLTNRIRIDTQNIGETGQKQESLSVEIDSKGKYVILKPLKHDVDGTTVSLIFDRHYHRHDKMFFEEEFFMRKEKSRKREIYDHPLLYNLAYVLEKYAIHVDIPINIKYIREKDDKIIRSSPFILPKIVWDKMPCLYANHKEFIFEYNYEDTNGLAGIFRFLLPVDEKGNISFATLIDSKFKIFIDSDGDFCATTPDYENTSLKIKLESKEDWSTAEIRGIYRDRYKEKPSASENSYDEELEMVDSFFNWTQDGLRVDFNRGYQTNENNRSVKTNIFNIVSVPGLNAAMIDIRRDWRVNLNVQRNDFIRDNSLNIFESHFYDLVANMLLDIVNKQKCFKNSRAKKKFIDKLIELSDWKLKNHIKNTFGIVN